MNMIVVPTGTMFDRQDAVDVMARAFSDDPVARWMYPEDDVYERHMPAFIHAFAGKAFVHRTGCQTPDAVGAALWLPPHVEPDDDALARVVQATLSGRRRDETVALMAAMGLYHPHRPHWYLPMIGVDPTRQRRGVGTELMRHGLNRCDREGAPAYLEASSEDSRRFYETLGFHAVGTIQVASSPPLWPMVRAPRFGLA